MQITSSWTWTLGNNPLVILVGLAAVVTAAPTPTRAPAPAPQSSGATEAPVLVRNVDKDLEVQVVQLEDGEYGVRVFKSSSAQRPILLPSQTWSVPPEWRAPGREAARVVHAELLSSGDVVIVLYSPKDGLDLIVLPQEIFKPTEATTDNAIIFPKVSVPWHPTVSTPAEEWTWPSDAEAVTPSGTGFRSASPEKATLPEE
ncbi:uncharacterized protein LOC134772638 [Penaeus indicus]|uniref:uncharacterized protein LOC134772638 n=1 Tax=Penaeus indicus TaxID=29960 RepID=UPI00300DAC56